MAASARAWRSRVSERGTFKRGAAAGVTFGLCSPRGAAIVQASIAERAMPDAISPAGDPESAKVIAVVSSIPLAVDLGRYDLAEAAFAPEIVIDYTSLWGGEPQRTTPAALMDAWRGLVPGFDATRHELRDVATQIDGDRATATAFVDGRHWIGGALWRPIGTYRWTLSRIRRRLEGDCDDVCDDAGDRRPRLGRDRR